MRFWNHVLQKREDVMGQNIGPYVTCNNDKFEAVKENPIDFTKYVDKSMDESVNCSKFATKSAVRKVRKSLERLSEEYDVEFKCPMSMEDLQSMYDKYDVTIYGDKKKRSISHFILNNDGYDDVSYFNEF